MQFPRSRLFSKRSKRKSSSQGTVFLTSLIFLFVLIGTFRLCNIKTLHEAKLTAIFIQETQGFYLLENYMHLIRDYVYQTVQNPRTPHTFLGAAAFRFKKHRTQATLDFTGSLSKQQIVPDDFPLQIVEKDAQDLPGWEIEGGPIFWKDNKKNANDERYLAEVFMVGSLKLVSNLIPDWTIRTVQTMEIERNPLCDFALYAEGDTTINTNISSVYNMPINGPVQINGNARFSSSNGDAANYITFSKKFNCAGHALKLQDNVNPITNYALPKKYHMLDNCENNQVTHGTGPESYYFNQYATDYGSTSMSVLDTWHNTFESSTAASDYDSYERYMFNTYRGNFNTRSRVYRPMGFDPSNYWGFWDPSNASQPAVGGTTQASVDLNEQVLNFCFGFHNLAQASACKIPVLYNNNDSSSSTLATIAMADLRGLNTYQMSEKARIVEMQKAVNFPGLRIDITTQKKDDASLYVPNNFIYPTYIANAFPAIKDNIYLNRYFNLAFQSNSILAEPTLNFAYTLNNFAYMFNYVALPTTNCILSSTRPMYMGIRNHKSSFSHITNTETLNAEDYPEINSIVKIKSTFSPTGHGDDNCPPDRIVDKGTYWYLDNYVTRITGEHYNFMYDRNRAKWIQMIDIDVGALTTFLNENETWNQDYMQPIVSICSDWQGAEATNTNKNYRLDDGTDIRYTYSSNRSTFFSNYADGSYVYPDNISHPPVIDIGVRLVNAKTLPNKGLTICCPYPLYIKGGFNITQLDRVPTSGEIPISIPVSGEVQGTASITMTIILGRDSTASGLPVSGTVSGTLTGTVSIANGIVSGEISGTISGEVSGTVSQNGTTISASGIMSGMISKTLSGTVGEMASLSIPVSVSGENMSGTVTGYPVSVSVKKVEGTASGTVSGTLALPTIKSQPPALIIADSITFLPAEWQDWRSQMDPINSHLWYNGSSYVQHIMFGAPTIYADIITGRTHPYFYIKNTDISTDTENGQTQTPNPDFGIHDAFRSLCDLKNPINLYGSLMLPYFSQEQWEPPIDFCKTASAGGRDPQIYAYPPLQIYARNNAGIPAAMPFYYRINRGRKTHCIGDSAYSALNGTTLYTYDLIETHGWYSDTKGFTDYHDALPNYLKYEVDPE